MDPFAGWITAIYRVILAICEHIGAEETVGVGGSEGVGVNEPAVGKVVVPALEVVKARFAVVVIPAVAQGVDAPEPQREKRRRRDGGFHLRPRLYLQLPR